VSDDIDSELEPEHDRAEDRMESHQGEIVLGHGGDPPEGLVESNFAARVNLASQHQTNFPGIIDALRKRLPPGDPALSELVRTLRLFRGYHLRLNDWNELHNHLSDILFNYGQFSREVERLSNSNEDPEPRSIGMHWHPVSQKVTVLLDWASAPRRIFEGEPFAHLKDRIVGPAWAVELYKSCDRLDALLRPTDISRLFILPRESESSRQEYVDINDLYDAGSDFFDVAEKWMYLVDRRVGEITVELLKLSEHELSILEEDEWTA
jgi:hypothetical protein